MRFERLLDFFIVVSISFCGSIELKSVSNLHDISPFAICTVPKVDNPATGDVIANVACLKASETKSAIAAASAAFPLWSSKTAKERGSILRRHAPSPCAFQGHMLTSIHSGCYRGSVADPG